MGTNQSEYERFQLRNPQRWMKYVIFPFLILFVAWIPLTWFYGNITSRSVGSAIFFFTVMIAADPAPKGKSYTIIADRLGKPDVKAALVACWDAAYTAHEQRELTARLTFKGVYVPSEYEDEPGKFTSTVDAAAGLAGVEAGGAACVKTALLAHLSEIKGLRESFTTTLTITVK